MSAAWLIRGFGLLGLLLLPCLVVPPRQCPPVRFEPIVQILSLSLSLFSLNLGGLLLLQKAAGVARACTCFFSGGDRRDFISLWSGQACLQNLVANACFKAGGIRRAYFHHIHGHSKIRSVLHLVRTGTLKTVPSSQESHCILRLFSKLLSGPNMYVSPCLSLFCCILSWPPPPSPPMSLAGFSKKKVTSWRQLVGQQQSVAVGSKVVDASSLSSPA